MRTMYTLTPIFFVTLIGSLLITACKPAQLPDQVSPQLYVQQSGTDVLLIGISPVDENIVWVAGTGGTVGRTLDGGDNWETTIVPGTDSLQFRDIHGVDANTAYVLSIGNGSDSRIYKTTDGALTWEPVFINPVEDAFYDCFDFWNADHGMVFSDAVEGAFPVLSTANGGQTWDAVTLPPARGTEGGFASSGTCLQVYGDSTVWIGTGAGDQSRLLRSDDRGERWISLEVPLDQGTATSGITSIHFLDGQTGIIAGGDISKPDVYQNNIATTLDGGIQWINGGQPTFTGALYGISYVPGSSPLAALAAGPGGLDYSLDNGQTWASLDTLNYWSVAFSQSGVGWASGTDGKIAKIVFD